MPSEVTRARDDSFEPWTADGAPFSIEYSISVLEELRQKAEQGFQTIPHGGIEIGAALFGERRGSIVRICEWRPIECSHSRGPGFVLSGNDLNRLRETLASAATELPGLEPVGWFHTHTRSEIFLSPDDVAIYDEFFPESWQIALVMRLRKEHPALAGFFFREPNGQIQTTGSRGEFTVRPDPLAATRPRRATAGQARADGKARPESKAHPDGRTSERAESRPASVSPEIPLRPLHRETRAPQPPAPVPVFRLPPVTPPDDVVPVAEPVFIPTMLNGSEQSPLRRWLIRIVAACALAGVLGLGLNWYVGDNSAAAVGLRVEETGRQLVIRWDHSAPAVVAADDGVLSIQDGKHSKSVSLDALTIKRGTITYTPEFDDVEVSLTVRKGGIATAQEFTRYLGRHKSGAALSPDAAERERLQAEAERLRRAIDAEAGRAGRLAEALRAGEIQPARQ